MDICIQRNFLTTQTLMGIDGAKPGGESLESKQQVKKMEVDINVREEENGFRIIFTRHTGALGEQTGRIHRPKT